MSGTTSMLSPLFLMTSTTKQIWPNGKRGEACMTTKPKQPTLNIAEYYATIYNEYTKENFS